MTKILCAFLIVLSLLALCACNKEQADISATTTQDMTPSGVRGETEAGFAFVYHSTELIPGREFLPDRLPEPRYTYAQPNEAQGGSYVFYNYGDIEVTVYDNGQKLLINGITVISPDLQTPEGLTFGDSQTQVSSLYGQNSDQQAQELLFTKGNTVLAVLMQDGLVAGLEYRLLAG